MLHVNQCHFRSFSSHYQFCACQDCNQYNVQRSCRYCLAAYHITPPLSTFVLEFLYMQKIEVMINLWNYHLYPLLVYPVSTFVSIHREKENFVLVATLLLQRVPTKSDQKLPNLLSPNLHPTPSQYSLHCIDRSCFWFDVLRLQVDWATP